MRPGLVRDPYAAWYNDGKLSNGLYKQNKDQFFNGLDCANKKINELGWDSKKNKCASWADYKI